MWDTDNIFLNGPYAPWREEGVAYDLEIEGEIPADLSGALYRVASNQHFRPENPARVHFFDGDGMVHAVFLRDGKATYRNRYVQTEGLKLEMKEGRAMFGSLVNGSGKPPVLDGSAPPFKNPANTNVTVFDDRLLVFCEVDVPHELRPDTLDAVGNYTFHGKVEGAVTAHFKMDPANGDMLFYGTNGTGITYYRADRDGVVLDSHKFDMGAPCFVHDFAVTENYAVWVISPQLLVIDQIIQGLPGMLWDPDSIPVGRFAVMNRKTGETRFFDGAEPFTASHFANAHELGNTLVVDAHRSIGDFGITKSELEHYPLGGDYNYWTLRARTIATRWEIDLTTGRVKETQLTDVNGELPRINDAFTGRESRYSYFVKYDGKYDWYFQNIAKVDAKLGTTELLDLDGLTAPSEPIFVAREGATEEDDGYLLSYWWDPKTDLSQLVIQDARDFDGPPIARVKLNHRVPIGPHGNWVPASEIEAAIAKNV